MWKLRLKKTLYILFAASEAQTEKNTVYSFRCELFPSGGLSE